MLPEFPDFAPIALDMRDEVVEAARHNPPSVSELTFANMFMWRRSHPIYVARRGEAVYVLGRGVSGEAFCLAPIGPAEFAEAALEMCRHLRDSGEEPLLLRLDRRQADIAKAIGLHIEDDRPNWDYVHRVSDLAGLRGGRYVKKRNRINKCLSEHVCEYRPLVPELFDDCLALQERWCNHRSCRINRSLRREAEAIREALANYEALQLFGGTIFVDGRLAAFTIAEAASPQTAVVHFEKADPAVEGLYQVMNQRFCREGLRDFEFVNREQDLGDPGLRRAKKSYHPHHMVEKFTARPGEKALRPPRRRHSTRGHAGIGGSR